ncbi:MAG: peptidylprolyl isomerase [Polaromonas sp.]|nr:peptidylprolyl isomerase [Polaromonas sp.]
MTKHSFKRHFNRTPFDFAHGIAALLLALPCLVAQAQTLRPSTGPIRLSTSPAVSSNPLFGRQRSADYIVAVVNSEPVTNNEMRNSLLRTEQQLTQAGTAMPPREELARLVLERLIADKAQLQEARLSGLRVDESAIENAVLGIAQQNQLTVDELRKRLVADGLTYDKFRDGLRDELLVSRFRQREVESRVKVTDADVDQFLRDQEGSSDAAAIDINLAQILVAVPENATPEQVAVLQAKAQLAADRARAGTDFVALVNEFSEASLRASGGQPGLRSADRYPPLFLEATEKLRAGGIAGPVRSGAGFHVLKVIEKRQAGMPGVNIKQTRARHILLRLSPQQRESVAKEKLSDIKKRVLAGQANFAVLARESSDDGSAKDGGDLGWTNPGMFVPEFEQAMNGLGLNQISEPVVSRFGVHLIQVLERRETQLSSRDQRELARSVIRDKKLEEAYAVWSQEIRGRAYVELREPPL